MKKSIQLFSILAIIVILVPGLAFGQTPVLTVPQPDLNFGSQPLNQQSPPISFEIKNTGDADLNVTSMVINGVDPASFSISQTSAGPIAPNNSFFVDAFFTPTRVGDHSANVDITSDGGFFPLPLFGFGDDGGGGGGGSGPPIFGGGFFDKGGVTQVEIFGFEIPNDLESVTVGTHDVTGISVVPDPESSDPNGVIIKGATSALISTILPGLFDVNITSTSLGDLSFPQLNFEVHTGPPAGGGIFGSFKDDGASGISVHIGGPDVPSTLPGIVTVGVNQVINFSHFEDLPDFPGEFIIEGTIALPIASFPEGPYDVVIDALSFPGVFFGIDTGPPPPAGADLLIEPQILTFGSAAAPIETGLSSTGSFTVTNNGGSPVDVTFTVQGPPEDFSISTTSLPQLAQGAQESVTVTFSPQFADPTGQATSGFVEIIVDGQQFGGVELQGFALQGPEIFDGVIFGKTGQNVTVVEISGVNLPTPAVGSTISVGTHTVSVTRAGPNPDHPEDTEIVGTVSADISTFTTDKQTLNVTIGADTFASVEFDIFKAGDVPQVIAGDIKEVSTGITEIELFGANIPSTTADFTSVTVGGFPVTGVAVTIDAEFETVAGIVIIEILGTISQDLSAFATADQEEVTLDIVLTAAALPGGSLTETGVRIFLDHFDGDPGPGPGPEPTVFNIHSGDFFDAGAGNVTVKLFSTNFPADIITSTITISGTGITAGSSVVTGVTGPSPDPNDTSGGGEFIEGTIVADFASLIEGDYAVDVTNSAEGPFNFPNVLFFPGGPGGNREAIFFLAVYSLVNPELPVSSI